MESIKNNKLNVIWTVLYVLIYAFIGNELIIPIFFAGIIIMEVINLVLKDYDKVFMQSILLIPLMGITKYNGIPFFNIYNAILATYLFFFDKNIKKDKKTFYIYFMIITIDLLRVLIFNNGLSTFYEFVSVPFLYISMLNCIFLYTYINTYQKFKNCSIFFILGTLLSILYGFIKRFLTGGLTFALINNSVVTRNSAAAGDSNYFGLYILISVAFLIAFCVIEKKYYLPNLLLSLFMLFMGLTSTSRMYYIMMAIIVGLIIFILLKGYFSKKGIILILITIVLMSSLYYARNLMFKNFEFLMSRFEEKDLSNGRNAIRNNYLEIMQSNIFSELFGIGIPRYNMRSGLKVFAHNLYLEIFICNGYMGTILLLALFFNFLKQHIHLKCPVVYIPLLMVIIAGLSLNFIEVDCFYIIFGLIFACLKFSDKELIAICNSEK